MNQLDSVLNAMRRHGNRITTWELLDLHVAQYQRVLFQIREKGYQISEAKPIEGQHGNFLYTLYEKEASGQISLFA